MKLDDFRIAVVAITRHGITLAGRVMETLPHATLFVPQKYAKEAEAAAPERWQAYQGKTGDQIPGLFANFSALLAVVSLGAIVRLIAPHIGRKESDPAVLVLDEGGRFVIPVLSGHVGGANWLANQLGQALNATPVLTTASDSQQTLAVDILGREAGWQIEADHDALVNAAAAVVNGDPVAVILEEGDPDVLLRPLQGRLWPAHLHRPSRLEAVLPDAFRAILWIGRRELPAGVRQSLAGKLVMYHPPELDPAAYTTYTIGIGCDRGASEESILHAIQSVLKQSGLRPAAIRQAASIDIKSDEAGLLQACQRLGWPLTFYPADELAKICVPNPSPTVLKYTGTPSVSEAAALLAAHSDKKDLVVEKYRECGADGRNVTLSLARIGQSTARLKTVASQLTNR